MVVLAYRQAFLLAYRLVLPRIGKRARCLDLSFGFTEQDLLLPGEELKAGHACAALFTKRNRQKLLRLYDELFTGMKGAPFALCDESLLALRYLQEIGAMALWKLDLDIGGPLEVFVRAYDRLDVPSERVRLYESAQME